MKGTKYVHSRSYIVKSTMNVLFTLMCVCRYKKNESAEEEAVRLAAWEKYLEGEEEEESKQTTQEQNQHL